jgi:DNA-binding NtrC family response regulator
MTVADRPDETPTVLVVEDDRDLAETYTLWLEPEYDVRTVYSAAEGLTWYDSAVDIVLLDRRMSDFTGTAVIQNMAQRDVDDQKALLTSVEPGSELVDLPCDEYLTKPITKTELRDAVGELQVRSKLDDDLQRHYTLTSKIVALEDSDATGSEQAVADLKRQAEQTRARIEDRLSELDDLGQASKILD